MLQPIVFMFSGQGSQYYQMGSDLFEEHSVFTKWMFQLDAMINDLIGKSIVDTVYDQTKRKSDIFKRTLDTHPAIFSLEYALAQVLLELGITPDYVLGASMGEFASAVIADVISLEDGLSCLIQQATDLEDYYQSGGMLAILDTPDLYKTTPCLYNTSELAAINYQSHFVVSGDNDKLADIKQYLKGKDINYMSLPVSQAFHSRFIDDAKISYCDFLKGKTNKLPQIPFISCVQADILSKIPVNHFWEIIRKPIAFQKTIQKLEKAQDYIYIDLGPSGTLANFVKYNLGQESKSKVFSIINPFGNGLKNLAKLQESLRNF